MPLPASVSDLSEVDEGVQSYYEQGDDGAYYLSLDGVENHPQVTRLKSAKDREAKERKNAKSEAQKFREKFGPLADDEEIDFSQLDDDTADKIRRIVKGEDSAEGQDGKGDGKAKDGPDPEKLKKQVEQRYTKQLESEQQRAETYRQRLHQTVTNQALTDALVKAGVASPYMDAAKALWRQAIQAQEDENGDAQPVVETDLGPVDVATRIKEWAQSDEGAPFVKAPDNAGGGAAGSGARRASGPNPWRDDSWNIGEQARIARDDPEKAKRLAQEAGKKPPRV